MIKFDENQLPLCEIDPLDGVTFFEYDDFGRTVAVTDPEGLRTGFAYDAHGNLCCLTRADGSTLQMEYDDNDNMLALRSPDGAAWQQAYDARGLMVAQTDPLAATTRYDYDASGQLLAQTNARQAVTQLRYDRHGLVAAVVDALGHESRYEQDALGNLLRQVDPLGQVSRYEYDAKGRLLATITPDGAGVRCEYDAEDQLVRYTDEAGAQTRLEYVGIGQIGKRLQADGHIVEYRYDSEEQLVAVINQRGETYQLLRDPLGRIVEEVDYWGQARRYNYDAAGRLTTTVDALGQKIAFNTDKMGRITRKTLPDIRHPGQQLQEHFVYDKLGQLIELRNPSRTVKRRYDPVGQLLEELQDGFRVGYGYDEVGNRVSRETSAGNHLAIGYDLRDQAVSIAINDESPILMQRDALGRTTQETLSSHLQRNFSYDSRNLLTSQSILKDAAPLFETRYDYDRSGNLTRRSDSGQGVDEYRYDAIGRLLQHTDPKGKIERFFNDPAGDRLRTEIKQVQARKVVGGDNDELVTWTREGTYQGVHYVFDRAGDLIRKGAPHGDAPDDLTLIWDANHRLAESRRNGQATHYGYDPLGRRVFKRNPTQTTWFFWDGDALLGEVQQANDAVDAAPVWVGNVASLIEVKARQQRLTALHERVREYVYYPGTFVPLVLVGAASKDIVETKVSPPATTTGPVDAKKLNDPVFQLRSGGGSENTSINGAFILGRTAILSAAREGVSANDLNCNQSASAPSREGDVLAGEAGSSSFGNIKCSYVFQVDPNGCPLRICDSFGRVVWSASWGGSGVRHLGESYLENNLAMQGQYVDAETGLNYNRYRYYDPEQAGYIGQDPLGLLAGLNVYSYVRNTLGWIDPLGLSAGSAWDSISFFRDQNGLLSVAGEDALAAGGAKNAQNTVALLRVGDREFIGMNSRIQNPKNPFTAGPINNITKFHAEGNAAQQAFDAGMAGKHKVAEMWVDRDLCHACGPSNGVGSLAKALGLDEILVHSPSGSRVFKAPCAQ